MTKVDYAFLLSPTRVILAIRVIVFDLLIVILFGAVYKFHPSSTYMRYLGDKES
jgi:hypothetical protein